jgi:dihydroorotase
VGALDKLEGFASRHGAAFYGLEPHTRTIDIVREEWSPPETMPFGESVVVPYRAGGKIQWRLTGRECCEACD